MVLESGKLERALDLVERLHLEKSFDLAMVLADDHRKLLNLIEDAKERRFGGEHQTFNATSPEYSQEDDYEAVQQRRITPEVHFGKRRLDQDGVRRVRAKQIYS